ncbi:HRDC domain-containing protein [Deinococcus sp. 43]|nr:HRDC domain-containing protein [Deinococcus sp. 43]MDK2014043.1 HRDC domain-containing protein [Deinococcus sp. 43]
MATVPVVRMPEVVDILHVDEVAPRPAEVQPDALGASLADEGITTALSSLRRDLARETGYAAYLIFPNATLAALAERRPRTMADFGGIAGLGPKRIEAYGERILAAIENAVRSPGKPTQPMELPDVDVHNSAPPPLAADLISIPPLAQVPEPAMEHPAAPVLPPVAELRPRTAAELLEQVRVAIEGDGGLLAVLEELAALPEMVGGLDPEQAKSVLEPLDDARGLLGTLVMLHKRARRQQAARPEGELSEV